MLSAFFKLLSDEEFVYFDALCIVYVAVFQVVYIGASISVDLLELLVIFRTESGHR